MCFQARYIVKRMIYAFITVMVLTTITFILMHMLPGSPFSGNKAIRPAIQAALTAKYGLDKPVFEQYIIYMGNVCTGDLGNSLVSGRQVTDITLKMMDLDNAHYAKCFLIAMEETSAEDGVDQMQVLEETTIRYELLFEPVSKHAEAYQRYYEKNQRYRTKVNHIIVNAMKSKIHLDQLVQQTEIMQTEQETLEREVNVDGLTGVYSRRYLEALMRDKSNGNDHKNMAIIILDVDYFKEYNDYYGHLKGDTVLQEIARCLLDNRQEGISSCRYGGDEFVCVCEGLEVEEIEAFIKHIRERLHAKALPHEKSHCSEEVTLSIGYAAGEEKAQVEMHLLFQLADQALYQSKRTGRNTYSRKRVDLL